MQCSEIEAQTGNCFSALVGLSTHPARRRAWHYAAREASRRSLLLRSVAELVRSFDDGGPFLVEVNRQLERLRKALPSAPPAVNGDRDPEEAWAETARRLEAPERHALYRLLLETAEPVVRRSMRIYDSELAQARRGFAGRAGAGLISIAGGR